MTNAEFIEQLYQDVLGRPGDPQGTTFWNRMLDAGLMSRAQVNSQIRNSTEATKHLEQMVHTAYREVLGRAPDTQGMVFWMDQLRSGQVNGQEALNALFAATPEGQTQPVRPGRTIPEYVPGTTFDEDGNPIPPDAVDVETPTGETPGETPGDGNTPDGSTGDTGTPDPYARQNARAAVEMILARYGLSDLTDEVVRLIGDNANDANIRLTIYNHPTFKARFPAISYENGDWVGKFTPEQYLEYERQAIGVFQAGGLPSSFYDQPQDFTEFIERNVSIVDLAARVNEGFTRVAQAPIQVRQQFAQWFGPQGDGALAAYFLDPDRAMRVMEEQMAAAEIAGTGNILGTAGLDQARATQLAQMGYNGRNSMATFRSLQQQDALFNESVTEGEDLTRVNEGVDAAFGLDEDAAEKIERRRAARVTGLQGGGGMLITQEGIGGRADQ
jgi:hypothetical protein